MLVSLRRGLPLALFLLGSCAGVAPDPQQADASKLPAVQLSSEEQAACRRDEAAAILATAHQRYRDAREIAERVLSTNPRSARAHAVLGLTMLERASQHDPTEWRGMREGEVELELARQLGPDDAIVGWLYAVFLAETGHLSAAAAAAEQALAATSTAPAADRAALLRAAGTYRYELGEERAALPHLEAFAALQPDDAEVAFRIGWCFLRKAQVLRGAEPELVAQVDAEAAALAFARGARLAPDDEAMAVAVATARLRAAECAGLRGEMAARDAHHAAIAAHLTELAERFPDSPEVRFHFGLLAEQQQQLAVAQAAYAAALERSPGHAGSALNLAALLTADGDDEAARAVLQRLLADPFGRRTLSRDELRRVERWLAQRTASDDK